MVLMQGCQLENWPEADREAWVAANTETDDPWDHQGTALRLRPATRRNYTRVYGIWLAWLDATSQLSTSELPGQRVTPERVQAWIRHMQACERTNGVIKLYLMSLHAIMRFIALQTDTRFVIYPGGRSVHELFPTKPKPFDPHDAADMLAHALRRHQEGLAQSPGRRRWVALRDAAIMSVLYCRGTRVSNLAATRIGVHLLVEPDGEYRLRYPGSMTKNGRKLEYGLPPECNRIMHDYLTLSRPHFRGADRTDELWMGVHGMALTHIGVTGVSRRRNQEFIDKPEGPHMARKWLTETARRRSPEAALDCAEMLGHSITTGVRHYSAAQDTHAGIRHARHICELRHALQGVAERAFAERGAVDEAG